LVTLSADWWGEALGVLLVLAQGMMWEAVLEMTLAFHLVEMLAQVVGGYVGTGVWLPVGVWVAAAEMSWASRLEMVSEARSVMMLAYQSGEALAFAWVLMLERVSEAVWLFQLVKTLAFLLVMESGCRWASPSEQRLVFLWVSR
jgi:hypothetical protein